MVTVLKECTVVIVGGGLTAGLAARQLTSAGIDVVVLERGGDHSEGAEAKLPGQRDELRWDTHQGLGQNWAVETYTLRHDRSQTALPIRWMEAFIPGDGLGGAANHWNGQLWRWSDYDPQLRSRLQGRYGARAIPGNMPILDWGVTYAELEPYHHLFEKLFGIAGKAGNIQGRRQRGGNPFEAPRRDDYPQGPLEPTEAGLVFQAATEKMGYMPFPAPAANSPGAYTNPDGQKLAACQYCGHCERFICEAGAKGTPEVLLYPMLRRRSGFQLRLRSHVLQLVYDAAGRQVRGVRYVDLLSGREYLQPAQVVMLGAFTMSNTKLLLTSRIGRPYDPADNTGVVGKNFCYQTMSAMSLFIKERWLNPFLASGATETGIDEFNNDNFDHAGLGFLGGGHIAAGVTNGRPIRSRRLPPGTPRWGTAWKHANAQWYAHSMGLNVQGSCYPHVENFLDLDPTYTDSFGLPLLRMTFDWRENETRMSQYLTARMVDIANTVGADIVGPAVPRKAPFDTRQYQTTHITGGTIMGTDPGTSVVSPHLQHWDAQNLFIVGASVYPHNSGYNPTGPLAALALRAGDDMISFVQRPRML